MPSEEIVRLRGEGVVAIARAARERFRISVRAHDPSTYIEKESCETSFSMELIDYAIANYPFGSICSWIARHEDADFIRIIRRQLFAYCKPAEFEGKRLLDFGCGSGASTFAIASVLPDTEVVGVDLSPERVGMARRIAEVQNFPNTRFFVSPSGDTLPPDLGLFDFVTLNAVYEHLLPEERRTLMPILWSLMKPVSELFVNQTPHRYFPYEHHSTGLWLINYLPDSLAHLVARKFARINPQLNRSGDWKMLLRGGIRGATEPEIVRNLVAKGGGKATILQPAAKEMPDRASYWLAGTGQANFPRFKKLVALLFRYSDRMFGSVPSPNIDLAIGKNR